MRSRAAIRMRLSASVLGFRDFRLPWIGQTVSTLTAPAVALVGEAGVRWLGAAVAFAPTLLVLRVPGLPQLRTPDPADRPAAVTPG